ncbi:hypothetical protein [Thiomicrorhabdus sediminis]|uniref:DUF3137 domain-containing protein n=1 Tax=Thiomicrorhabdus sediminis TaxID=2580412 RepID=A0A4P9K5Y9_9GAMM|nr:hypothetical protein [Thiomicrorhabdus sediminis]QCU89696.1 hypothetical protein FE785_03105 [Thiomicrorhabdus sediminis]
MGQFSQNRQFADLLKQLKTDISLARHNQDLLDTIQMVKDYPGPLKFNNLWLYIVAAIFATASVLVWLQSANWIKTAIPAAAALLAIFYAIKRNRRLKNLAKDAFFKSILIDNQLSLINLPIGDFKRLFCGFKQGNHKNEIKQAYQSDNGFIVFHYHYVEREKDHDDKHYHDEHFHRYGIVMSLDETSYDYNGVVICHSKPEDARFQERFKPAYNKFNRKLKAYGKNQMQLARLLTPVVVEKLAEYEDILSDMLVQISGNQLCIYGELELMQHNSTPYDYTTPDEFAKDILIHEQFDNLNQILALANTLRREHQP